MIAFPTTVGAFQNSYPRTQDDYEDTVQVVKPEWKHLNIAQLFSDHVDDWHMIEREAETRTPAPRREVINLGAKASASSSPLMPAVNTVNAMPARVELATHVRAARRTDIPLVADLIAPFVEDGKLLARTYEEFDDLLPHFFVAIAEENGQVIGCAALEIYSPKLAEIRSLAVATTAQGRGVGKLLVNACVERARENGILEVMAITSSDSFFQSCGFDYTLPGEKKAVFLTTRD